MAIFEFIKTHVIETTAAAVATALIVLCGAMLTVQRHKINSLKTSNSTIEQLKVENEQLNDKLLNCKNNITNSMDKLTQAINTTDDILNHWKSWHKTAEDTYNKSVNDLNQAKYAFKSSVCSIHSDIFNGLEFKPLLNHADDGSIMLAFELIKDGKTVNDTKTEKLLIETLSDDEKYGDVKNNLAKALLNYEEAKKNYNNTAPFSLNDIDVRNLSELSKNLSTVTSNLSDVFEEQQ